MPEEGQRLDWLKHRDKNDKDVYKKKNITYCVVQFNKALNVDYLKKKKIFFLFMTIIIKFLLCKVLCRRNGILFNDDHCFCHYKLL